MKNLGKIPFDIRLVIAFLVVFCASTPNLSHAQNLNCTRVVDGDTIISSNGEKILPLNPLNTIKKSPQMLCKRAFFKIINFMPQLETRTSADLYK